MHTPLLAIDTAGPRLQLALNAGGRVDILVEAMAQGQAERIFPAIGELLATAGLGYRGLGGVAVTTGPGSFTGLRIGISAARGLGLGLGIPVLGVPSLTAISLAAGPGPVSVLLDARRGEAYFEHFPAAGHSVDGPSLLKLESARDAVPPTGQLIEGAAVDIRRLAEFAVKLDPGLYPPNAVYVRNADAKPQDKFRVAREPAS